MDLVIVDIHVPVWAAITDREKNRKSLAGGDVSGGGGGRGGGGRGWSDVAVVRNGDDVESRSVRGVNKLLSVNNYNNHNNKNKNNNNKNNKNNNNNNKTTSKQLGCHLIVISLVYSILPQKKISKWSMNNPWVVLDTPDPVRSQKLSSTWLC